mmetsp:Transcript_24651/g.93184  ORF Transcript_24651/g.93184 Transcript_24651/m.93184 type:complete len:234 (+) Transcript_24651:1391-2092(+)
MGFASPLDDVAPDTAAGVASEPAGWSLLERSPEEHSCAAPRVVDASRPPAARDGDLTGGGGGGGEALAPDVEEGPLTGRLGGPRRSAGSPPTPMLMPAPGAGAGESGGGGAEGDAASNPGMPLVVEGEAERLPGAAGKPPGWAALRGGGDEDPSVVEERLVIMDTERRWLPPWEGLALWSTSSPMGAPMLAPPLLAETRCAPVLLTTAVGAGARADRPRGAAASAARASGDGP